MEVETGSYKKEYLEKTTWEVWSLHPSWLHCLGKSPLLPCHGIVSGEGKRVNSWTLGNGYCTKNMRIQWPKTCWMLNIPRTLADFYSLGRRLEEFFCEQSDQPTWKYLKTLTSGVAYQMAQWDHCTVKFKTDNPIQVLRASNYIFSPHF